MNVLSLFDGMSCGQLALERAGIKVDKYYASEIDKYAIQITQKNYPNTIQLGDITKWKEWDIDWASIDLIIAGSPCQSFSIAGNGKGFEGKSGLFYTFSDILHHVKTYNPNIKFLLENVVMKKEWENVISRILDINPILIDSALVSAQRRRRLYWTNIKTKKDGFFDELVIDIPQPKNKGIKLREILEQNVDSKYILSDKMTKNKILYKNQTKEIIGHSGSGGQKGEIYSIYNKIGALCATDYCQPKQVLDLKQYVRVRKYPIDIPALQSLLINAKLTKKITNKEIADKLNCPITLVEHWFRKDKGFAIPKADIWEDLKELLEINDNRFDNAITEFITKENNYEMNNRIYSSMGKSPTLLAVTGENSIKIFNENYVIRKLIPIEYERLQTVPDNYTEGVSNTQRYKMLGNGWTVDVIVHIFSFLNK